MKKMKKIILLLICLLTIISCSETKQELKRITFTSDSEEAIALMEEFMMNNENREAESDIQQKLIDSILKLDPKERLSTIQALKHPYFKGLNDEFLEKD